MLNKQIKIKLIVLVIAVGLVWFFVFSKKEVREPVGDIVPTPTISSDPSSSPAASAKPTVSQKPDVTNQYPPAECALTGSIDFRSPTVYENKDANIIYKNIDSIARHIIWTVFPEENLSVGPNLFVNLPLPDGIEDVTLRLPDNPKSKEYTLKARVTYGVIINRDLVIKEAYCSGQISVKLNY